MIASVRPSLSDFEKLAARGNLIPVSCEILADQDTPVSAYQKMRQGQHAFLLESVEGGERWARYSFLGTGVSSIFRSRGPYVEIFDKNKRVFRGEVGDPFRRFRDHMKRYRPVPVPDMPRFYGGAVGYIGYDAIRFFERLPERARQSLDVWDIYLVLSESLLVFDNVRHTIRVLSCCFLSEFPSVRAAYQSTLGRIERTIRRLRSAGNESARRGAPREPGTLRISSNMSRQGYLEAVRRAKRHVRAGDVIQVVLAQRLQVEEALDPWCLYRALRTVNPSPYMFLLQFPDYALVGSSPEVLVRVEDRQVEVRPIAGTRPRGADLRSDRRLEEDLRRSVKEIAEHIMLVDLGRNDVGRVSAPGTVEVAEFMTVERYSHVMHLVSHVKGRLTGGKDCFDAFRACFPAGTLTGAPKIRAMEIVETLEPDRRGPYGGAVGYFGFSGNMDMAIAIRTILAMPETLHFQVGAGIVADSRPEREYQECLNKARALVKAIQMARHGLVPQSAGEDGVVYDAGD
ncbi:MAG: anthranilate synthase component I [bacterium]